MVNEKLFLTTEDVAELLGRSRTYAYYVLRALQDELKAKGFAVEKGRIPRKFFLEKYGA